MSSDDRLPNRRLDDHLRRLLDPAPGVAPRVASSALRRGEAEAPGGSSPPVRRESLLLRRPLAASLLAATALAATLWTASLLTGRRTPSAPRSSPAVSAPVKSYSIANSGGVITVTSPSGQIELLIAGDHR